MLTLKNPSFGSQFKVGSLFTMLFSISELVRRWEISPKSVLHIGAHLAEESEMYQSAGWNEVLWIEANPALMTDLRKKSGTIRTTRY